MKAAVGFLLALLSAAYPFAVHASLGRWPTGWLLGLVGAVWLARALLRPADSQPGGRWLPALALAGCIALALINTESALRAYPVMMNALLLLAFGVSLVRGRPVIERLARLRQPCLPPEGVRYTRRVTQVWCGFFLVNGLIAAALGVWGSWRAWTWYNGAISYALIGMLLAGEWLVRPRMTAGPVGTPP
ncbi:COG4648 family protein [Bordetella petrii]|nr:membrane protein [Bordetella petrii]